MKILLLNIWPEWPFSRTFLDHREHEIWHVCEANGLKYIDTFLGMNEVRGLTTVDSDDVGALMEKIQAVYAEFPFERVVAFDETTILPAAFIREIFNIPGPRVADIEPYRNKRKMKELLAGTGVRVIRDLDRASIDAANFVPCVIKRVDGAASQGVHICHRFADFEQHLADVDTGALLEEYVAGDVLHVDGAFNASGLVAMPHAYIGTCYDHYVHSKPLGSVGIDDPVLKSRVLDFTKTVVGAFPLREGVFHLELIRTKADELVFLEIACRTGGGEIYGNFLEVYNFDLLGFFIDSQLGREPKLAALRDDVVAGFLMLNNFPHLPGTFTALRSEPLAADTCVYSMKHPLLGRTVDDSRRHFATFSLRGKTSAAVRDGIDDLIANVTLDSTPLAAAAPQSVQSNAVEA